MPWIEAAIGWKTYGTPACLAASTAAIVWKRYRPVNMDHVEFGRSQPEVPQFVAKTRGKGRGHDRGWKVTSPQPTGPFGRSARQQLQTIGIVATISTSWQRTKGGGDLRGKRPRDRHTLGPATVRRAGILKRAPMPPKGGSWSPSSQRLAPPMAGPPRRVPEAGRASIRAETTPQSELPRATVAESGQRTGAERGASARKTRLIEDDLLLSCIRS